ncbi:MAG TPA: hypothetical protein VGG74_35665 [Kofleriaceae bacterium]|jgi:hypothetical protein
MPQILLSLLFAAAAAVPFDGGSASAPPPPDGRHDHGPPQEAIDACTNLQVDDACSFKLHDHDVTGTCKARPDDSSQLACRPDHPPPHGPPPYDSTPPASP